MAVQFTYDDFTNALNSSGMANQFSDADMKLAQDHPDAGITLINLKKAYANATTDEERAMYHQQAQDLRSSYGEYTSNTDGTAYYQNQMSPGSFTYDAAPTYSSSYSGQQQDLLNQMENYGSFSYGAAPTYTNTYGGQQQDLLNQMENYGNFSYKDAPTYTNRYDDKIQGALNTVTDYGPFAYDYTQDPLFSQYKKEYNREGQRAAQDTMGQAAAMSGGLPSSYAAQAAQQSQNYYNAQLTDKIPELDQIAYNQYQGNFSVDQAKLAALQGAEASDYGKYQDQLGQYNTDKSFDYGAWMDKYNMLNTDLGAVNNQAQQAYQQYQDQLGQYNTDRNFNYGAWMDQYNMLNTDLGAVDNQDQLAYQKYQDQLAQYNTDRSFNYGQYMDEYNSQQQDLQNKWNEAQTAAGYGDNTWMQALHVDMSHNPTDLQMNSDTAAQLAAIGDFSGYAKPPYNWSQEQIDQAHKEWAAANPQLAAAIGQAPAPAVYSSGRSSGSSTSAPTGNGEAYDNFLANAKYYTNRATLNADIAKAFSEGKLSVKEYNDLVRRWPNPEPDKK